MEFVLGIVSLIITTVSIVVTIWAMRQKEDAEKRLPQIIAKEIRKILNAALKERNEHPQRLDEANSRLIFLRSLQMKGGPIY